ncbi:MAG: NUDIX hydrolase [Desulfobacca sp.]|uniref:NUDIX hydrolase n=1 Tax=Desulfobacca sp. TaxID=2067990 RepID=UPI00404A6245
MPFRQDLYKFCPQCGGRLEKKVIQPKEPARLVCSQCGFVFYLDPKLAGIAIIPWQDGLVLARRAIEPGYGLWVAPGGFVDVGELVEDAVVREVREEVLLDVRIVRLLNVYSYRGRSTVIVAYVAEVVAGTLGAGHETLEAQVFRPEEIPWGDIAFASTQDALREYLHITGQTSPTFLGP